MGIFMKKCMQNASLGIWEITETLEELFRQARLSDFEKKYYTSLRNPVRRKHWLSYRLILPHIFPASAVSGISYDTWGKPHMENGAGHISVSHSGAYSVLIVSTNCQVGVDIEHMHHKIFRIAHKFLSDQEAAYVSTSESMENLYLIWCAKEALYKLHGRGSLSFREHLHIDPFVVEEKGQITGYINQEGSTSRNTLFYERIGSYMMVYTIGGEQ